MGWLNLHIWGNIYLLRYCTVLFTILLIEFIWRNNIYKIKEKFQNIQITENTKLYWQIFLKHLSEKRILIILLLFLTLILIFISIFCKDSCSSSLLGVSASALVTVVFLDSINQYVAEKKFLDVSKEIKNTIYSLYYSFSNLVIILDKGNLSKEDKYYYRNSTNTLQDSMKLCSYCENVNFKHSKELTKEESTYANHYLKKLKDDIEKSIQNINSLATNVEMYGMLFLINNLYKEFRNTDAEFFTIKPNDIIGKLFGGVNESLLKNSLKSYNKLLKKIDSNDVLKCIPIIYKQEIFCRVEISNPREL